MTEIPMLHLPIANAQTSQPVLLVCLRHLGCTFAREALADLQAQRPAIEATGTRLVVAHLEPPSVAAPVLARYGLGDVETISDPRAEVYESCGLGRGGFAQLAAPRVLRRWVQVALSDRRGAGWTGADVRRMPGVFLVEGGRIRRAYRHATSADRPDYVRLCRAESGQLRGSA
jgi:hypothetical protein